MPLRQLIGFQHSSRDLRPANKKRTGSLMKFLKAVDLFCGVGGFALGMHNAGIKIARSIDYDPAVLKVHAANIRQPLYRLGLITPIPVTPPEPAANGTFRRGQIHTTHESKHAADLTAVVNIAPEIARLEPDLIFGGPPCQAFSSAGKGEGDDDARSLLTEAYAITVATARPKYFVMENVKGLRKSETFQRAVTIFRRAGYGLSETVVDASYFGTPQARERLILAGCLDESDGWFHAYLNQYKTSAPLTVADALGAEFGTAYADFKLDPDCGDMIPEAAKDHYKGYRLRARDLARLQADDVTPETRFYFCTPGGKESAAVHRVDRPSPTLIRTSMHLLPETYRPVEGDPVDLRRLWQPTFAQYARMAGYPEDWNWGKTRAELDEEGSDAKADFGARQRQLMLANSVPPPLAHAIGRAIVDHHERRIPVAPVEADAIRHATWQISARNFRRYGKWLRIAKGLAGRPLTQELSDLRSAKGLVASRKLPTTGEELKAFDRLPETDKDHMPGARKSQLRRTLVNMIEFEWYQSHVRDGFFSDDDEAYADGELHYLLSPQAEIDDLEYEKEQERLRMEEQSERMANFMRRFGQDRPNEDIPTAAE
jgi:DNA-cytosine methyltransferase